MPMRPVREIGAETAEQSRPKNEKVQSRRWSVLSIMSPSARLRWSAIPVTLFRLRTAASKRSIGHDKASNSSESFAAWVPIFLPVLMWRVEGCAAPSEPRSTEGGKTIPEILWEVAVQGGSTSPSTSAGSRTLYILSV